MTTLLQYLIYSYLTYNLQYALIYILLFGLPDSNLSLLKYVLNKIDS